MKKWKNACVYLRTAQTWLFRSVCVNLVVFRAKWLGSRSFFTCYDEFDVLGWFPCENIQERMCLHANGSNRPVSERLGQLSALSHKIARGALFFTCYDEFDVL